jgi:predicted amidohydrolase
MTNKIKVACIQMTSGPNITANLFEAERMIRGAAKQGAVLIATPENTCHILTPGIAKLETSMGEAEHPALPFFSALARELKIWLLIGSLSIRKDGGQKLANRSYLFAPDGEIKTRYDKLHLFNACLPTGETYREGDVFENGHEVVVADAGFAKLGLSICYDVRFPQLYRKMAKAGAKILMIPAAFVVPTGQLHWEVLLRARAIENGAFVIAPAQTGEHQGGRLSYGHSLIIDPWGTILADGGEECGAVVAEIDLDDVESARTCIPSLSHDCQVIEI